MQVAPKAAVAPICALKHQVTAPGSAFHLCRPLLVRPAGNSLIPVCPMAPPHTGGAHEIKPPVELFHGGYTTTL